MTRTPLPVYALAGVVALTVIWLAAVVSLLLGNGSALNAVVGIPGPVALVLVVWYLPAKGRRRG